VQCVCKLSRIATTRTPGMAFCSFPNNCYLAPKGKKSPGGHPGRPPIHDSQLLDKLRYFLFPLKLIIIIEVVFGATRTIFRTVSNNEFSIINGE